MTAASPLPDLVKERPLLFSAPMVRALLEGRKTQTRRTVKMPRGAAPCVCDHPSWACDDGWYCRTCGGGVRLTAKDTANTHCPYGVPGDLLVARETFRLPAEYDDIKPSQVRHDAPVWYEADGGRPEGWGKTRVSIHMPRWASRLTLRITDVRVERLQDIGEADALAEGVEPPITERDEHDWSICPQCGGTGLHGALGANLGVMEVDCVECDTHRKRYQHLWNHINGPGSWDANPFVWAISFEVLSDTGKINLSAESQS